MAHGVAAGATSYGYNQSDAHGQMNGHVVRAALMNMQNQLEPGHCCPLVMTSAAIPVLQAAAHSSAAVGTDKASSAHAQLWLDKVLSRRYDSSNKPIHQKEGATLGMSMTEKQGGSDIRANTTTAVPEEENIAGEGAAYRLWGHKWFTSAPMCDGFLTLAKVSPPNSGAEELREVRPTCFLVPRWLPDGSRNSGFRIMRLKNKLADRANASSEVEYHGAYGQMLGGEGKGLQTILKMVQMTRLDCTLGAAGGARRALSLALNHAHTRSAFGTPLVQQPMMENLLTDLCITSEAMTLSAMRMASAHARSTLGSQTGLSAEEIAHESDVFRVGVAILKYYCTKSSPNFAYECMEIFGGNGFTEDHAMARLFRHSPLNSIWEGSGNIMALDVLRASKALPAFVKDMQQGVRGDNKYFDAYCDSLSSLLGKMAGLSPTEHAAGDAQRMARFLVDRLAIGYQASLLLKLGHENGAAADAFIQSRIYPAVSTGNSNPTAFGLNYGATTIFDPSLARLIIDDHSPVFASSRPDNINWDRTL